MKLSNYIFLFSVLLILFSSCNKKEAAEPLIDSAVQAEREDKIIQQYLKEKNITAQKTDLGIYYIVLAEGTGAVTPKTADSVVINYEGQVLYGRQFDSSYEKSNPLAFRIGKRTVVIGFEEAVKQMKVGEKTRFFIPSRYVYGQGGRFEGTREIIPPFATLIFEIKLEKIL